MTINKISKTAPKSLSDIGSRGKVEIWVDFSNENLEEEFAITMFDRGFSDCSVQEESEKYNGGISTCYMVERCDLSDFNAAYKVAKENSLLEASAKSAIAEDDTVIAEEEEEPESSEVENFVNALDDNNYFLLLSDLPLLAFCGTEGCQGFIVMKNGIFDIEVIAPGESFAPGIVSFLVSPHISKYEARELIRELIVLYSGLPEDPCDNAVLLQDIKYTILDRSYSIASE